jgi:hypothetical protein
LLPCKGNKYDVFRVRVCSLTLMKQQYVVTHRYTCILLQETEKTWQILNRPTLKQVNYEGKGVFFVDTFWLKACLWPSSVVMQESHFDNLSVLRQTVVSWALSYPARNAHAPYYILIRGLPISALFFHLISWAARFCLKNFILRRIQRDIIIKAHKSSCKVQLFFPDFNHMWIFSTHFRKILKYQIS